jgi:hypothetical protein
MPHSHNTTLKRDNDHVLFAPPERENTATEKEKYPLSTSGHPLQFTWM